MVQANRHMYRVAAADRKDALLRKCEGPSDVRQVLGAVAMSNCERTLQYAEAPDPRKNKTRGKGKGHKKTNK